MSEVKQPRCRGCGAVIEWIEILEDAPDGVKTKRIPVDPKPATYEFNHETLRWRRSSARVTHFATCPKASDFSAQKKASAPVQGTLGTPPKDPWWQE